MLRNCPNCGRLLTTPPGTPCAHCLATEDAAVGRILAHLEAGGAATMGEVAQTTGTPLPLLRRLVRTGRITLADGVGDRCVLCGGSLEGEGRLCYACARRVRSELPATGGAGPRRGASGPSGRGAAFHSMPAPLPSGPFPQGLGREGDPAGGGLPPQNPRAPRR